MARIRLLGLVALLAIGSLIIIRISTVWDAVTVPTGSTVALGLAFLWPSGLTLVAWSALPADRSEQGAARVILALALALVGYWATGFALHFGSVASVSSHPGLSSLTRLFSLAEGDASARWGLFGLTGFFLRGDASTPIALQLFLSHLPLITSVVLIVLLGLPRRTPLTGQLLVGAAVSAVSLPLAGHWVGGGGWLAHLGETLDLGHGLVDFSGIGSAFLVGGATVLAATLLFRRPRAAPTKPAPQQSVRLPAAQPPLYPALGLLLAGVGWIGLVLSDPLLTDLGGGLNGFLALLNGLAGLAGGALLAQLYGGFTTGRFDPLLGARGGLAGLVAASAGAPFMPTGAALATGAFAGLLLPLGIYTVDRVLRLDDAIATTTGYGLAGLWGLLAVALFADGRWGQGWNGSSALAGQGVSGLLVAPGLQPDRGQLAAQVWGCVALFALGFLLPWGILKILASLKKLRPGRQRRKADAAPDVDIPPVPDAERPSSPSGLERAFQGDDRG